MPVSPARAAAFDVLLRVERDSAYASELLHSTLCARLSASDHALATELTMGVLRWRSLIDYYLAPAIHKPISKLDLEVLLSLRLGLYQLLWLDRIPSSAAVNQSVDLVKRGRKASAATFVNAVLRKLASSDAKAENAASTLPPAQRFAHPEWLVARWSATYGDEVAAAICRYDQQHPGTSLRIRNPAADPAAQLNKARIKPQPGRLLKSALRIESGDLSSLPPAILSHFAIHDEASQLIAALAGHAVSFLDCCAAPGGKALAILDRNPSACAIAVEFYPHRARLLSTLLANASATSATVVAADARQLPLNATFDLVLADVPCSGTGTLARNPEIKWRLQPSDLLDLQARQREILASAMQRVAPGGRLIYSTCSLEKEENEAVVEQVLATTSGFRLLNCADSLAQLRASGELVWSGAPLTSGPYLWTLPGIHPCDGFFAAMLESF